MRKQTIPTTGLVLLMVMSFLATPDTAQAQAAFPIGLTLEYHVVVNSGLGETEYDRGFEVLGWATEIGPNILEGKTTRDSLPWYDVYFDAETWERYNDEGDETGYYLFPPYWMPVSGMAVGTEVEFTVYSYTEWEFIVQADIMVTVPAGTFMCKHLRYTYSFNGAYFEYDLYYETSLGILVKCWYFESIGSGNDYSNNRELTGSNMDQYLIFGMPLMLFIGIVAAVIVIIVVIIIVVFVLRRRST